MMQLNETASKSTSRTNMENEIENTFIEIDDMDEFVDATDLFEDEDDVYDNIQFVVDENNDDFDYDMDDHLHELGLMLNSTLASDYDGANAARLNAHFFNDWRILLEKKALELGFPDLEELLKSEYMKDYVEQTSSINGVAIYGAVSKPANEHILRRVADCKLNEDQKAEKRRKQRLVELKNPENRQNFLEGKRRILEILLDLKAYKTEADYQTIRDEYIKRHNVSLNALEHQRLFMNKSAFKNFCRVFYREAIIINHNPIRIKLRSPDIKIPERITEEDLRLLANINKIELPIFPLEYPSLTSDVVRKERTPEYLENVAAPDGDILKKPVDLNEDKYTGDEESADSSDSEVKVSKKYRKKKFRGNMNTFNISSGTQSLLQIEDIDRTAVRYSHSEKNLNHVEQSVPLTNSEENKQVGKRLSVAERSLQQSLNYSGERNQSSSSSTDLSDRNSAGMIRELNKVPYGSYSVPSPTAGQSISRQGTAIADSASYFDNYRRPTEIVQKLSSNGFHDNAYVHEMETYQSNRFQQHGQGYSDNHTTFRSISPVQCFPPHRIKEVAQLSEGTQTDENWLENLLDELGCRNSKRSPLQKLVEVIELLVDIRSPNPVLLSSLPQIVGLFYGTPLNPEKDQNYRITWREIVRSHCSAEILIAPLPNGEEVLIKK